MSDQLVEFITNYQGSFGFLLSVKSQYLRNGGLSPKQWAAVQKCMLKDKQVSRSRGHATGSNYFYSPESGQEWYQNKNGRCEDAPCCGCCNS